MRSLLDPTFVGELEVLRRRLEVRARSGRLGERGAKRKGASAEFEDHRSYAPGDDLRRIDWAAYARSGEPVLKLFRAEEDVVVRLLCDASLSMRAGSPSKLDAAKRLAAAVGYMALAGGERAQLVEATDRAVLRGTSSRGKVALPALLRAISELAPTGKTNLASAVETVVRRSPRPGALVVISDFFDPGPVLTALTKATASGHDVSLVQVLAPEDLEPPLEGDLTLEDVETGELLDVTIDGDSLRAYRARLEQLFAGLRAHARRFGGAYVRAASDGPLEPAVRDLVAREVA